MNKEVEFIEKIEILQLKIIIAKMKSSLEEFKSRLKLAGEKIHKL